MKILFSINSPLTSTLPRYFTSKKQLFVFTAASSAGHILAGPPAPSSSPVPPPASAPRSSRRRKLERKLRLSLSIRLQT